MLSRWSGLRATQQARSSETAAFAKALKLSFAVVRIGERRANVSRDWRFMSIAGGRNAYRQMIDVVVEEAKVRKAA
ncbi:hypothetical protein JQ596_28485 [Bradyrhizobium manausense]|uniref:hypothetical protein n=1 Tax=Bradyrhizobium TaxID=374 RepID=UPI001BAC25F5|nr:MULTISPECIES: hypothetical protein [Bradyrhizobium]MBR0829479.1 hypothetical protein [Bradyrhizobium manausense]UVO25854.1 hypothetical protein KUF59_25125 [Bradyrhizobium arachidis]